jgi:hypothetical protein
MSVFPFEARTNEIRMGGVNAQRLVEGGKAMFSAVNAGHYDEDRNSPEQAYHDRTRRERHEDQVRRPVPPVRQLRPCVQRRGPETVVIVFIR